MAQFCRYCDHMHVTGFGYCDIKDKFYQLEHLAHTNDCGLYSYNPIDALRKHRPGHQPREEVSECTDPNQTTIFDFLG